MVKKRIRLILMLLFAGGLLAGCQRQSSQSITAVGSTALQPLIEAAGETYSQNHLGVFVNVQGGGSGTGLSQIQEGAVDLGNSDVFAAQQTGIKQRQLVDHKVAVIGITPIIQPKTGVKNLTLKKLKQIFTGKITNWRQVGGQNQPIVLINRAQGSGTRVTFEQAVLKGEQPTKAQEQDSSGMVRQIVATTPGAISYVAFSYVDKTVQALQLNGVTPTDQHVTTNAWPIWSYEHVYTKGQPTGLTKQFVAYLLSAEVQHQMVPKLGYIPIDAMQVVRQANGQVKTR